MSKKIELILCSQSPRRKELLAHLGVKFQIKVPDIDESLVSGEPRCVAMELARLKAQKIFYSVTKPSLCIGADTVVVLNKKIYGKPTDSEDAQRILKELEGKWHEVVTGVALVGHAVNETPKEQIFFVSSKVYFEKITSDLLDLYSNSKEPLDKAGAYGIQGQALSFIKEIQGSYSNVVGLPLCELYNAIKNFMDAGSDDEGKWRELFY